MRKYTITDSNGKTWERISKRAAKIAYDKGLTVVFCPVNIRPFTPWHLESAINKDLESCSSVAFENVVNAFEYYNCTCNETGRYTAFYVQVEREVTL